MIELPQYIDPEAWLGFCEMRRAMRKVPFTERAQKMILQDLERIKAAGHCPNAALDQSTVMGWRGVWPAKEKQIEAAASSQALKTTEMLKQQQERGYTAPPPELRLIANKFRRTA